MKWTRLRRFRARSAEDAPGRRTNRLGVLAMVTIAVLVNIATVAVPAQAWWQARGETAERHARLEVLQAENAELERRRSALDTDLEIEQRARADYDLVYPNEEPYAVLPPPQRNATWFHAWPL